MRHFLYKLKADTALALFPLALRTEIKYSAVCTFPTLHLVIGTLQFRNMILDQSDGTRIVVMAAIVAAGLFYVRESLQCGHCVN